MSLHACCAAAFPILQSLSVSFCALLTISAVQEPMELDSHRLHPGGPRFACRQHCFPTLVRSSTLCVALGTGTGQRRQANICCAVNITCEPCRDADL